MNPKRILKRAALMLFSFFTVLALYRGTKSLSLTYSYSDFQYDFTTAELRPLDKECIFPEVNPFDPYILDIAGLKKGTLTCNGHFLPEITYIDGLSIRINASRAQIPSKLVICKYRNITRVPYKDNSFSFSQWSESFTESINITEEHEFIHVKCNDRQVTDYTLSNSFYSLVPKRAHLNALYKALLYKRRVEFKPKETLNIVAVALDGLPRHQMVRSMPKTYKLLTQEFKSFDFTMHGQTGDNTFPNMLSLLSANSYEEIKKWWSAKIPQDVFNLIWHDFENAGYRTLFTEDNPTKGGFYWTGNQFLYPQTSYWNRPLELAMEKEKDFLWKKGWCIGSRSIVEYHLDYLTRFLDTFPADPVACMTIISEITHLNIANAALVDDHIFNFYKILETKGHLNNSLVVFFSDHGSRWGKIRETHNGVVESRNPFLILTFPLWFLKKYPQIARNLETNTRRLTTHFDTRLTLLDILYFKAQEPIPPFKGKHGRCLFQEIPKNRTCADASIPEEHCLCGLKVEKYLNLTYPEVSILAKSLLFAVKQKSDPENCEEYSLGKVLHVGVLDLPNISNQKSRISLTYSVRLSVEPGGAIFESTITMNPKTNETAIRGGIIRLNMYRGEVECQPSPSQQMYCYCKGNDENKQSVIAR